MRWRRSSGSALSRSSVEPPAWRRRSVTASIASRSDVGEPGTASTGEPATSAARQIPREGTATRRRAWDGQHGRAGDPARGTATRQRLHCRRKEVGGGWRLHLDRDRLGFQRGL
jgi:hypothetical protein